MKTEKRSWEASLSEVNSEIHCLQWDSYLCDSEGWGSGFSVVEGHRRVGCVVWGRVCPDWEACSLYLLEVGIREWEKLGES